MSRVRWVGLVSFVSFWGTVADVHAQTNGAPPLPRMDRSFDVQLFHPAVGGHSFISLDSAEVLEHRLFHVGLVVNYERQPFVFSEGSASAGTIVPVRNLGMSELVGAVGIRNRFEIGAALPLALTWGGDAFDSYGRATGSTATALAVGDLRLEGKSELVGFGAERSFLLSLSAGGTLPTGDEKAFLGEKTVSGRVRTLLEYQRGERFRAVLMLGALFRQKSQFFATPESHAALYGVAAEAKATDDIGMLAEVTGRYASTYVDTNPAEADAALRFYLPSMLNLILGAGFGLNDGIGSPSLRGYVGLGWAPDFRDRDGDGVPDISDRCPDEGEDRDGYQDDDGCPEIDNEGDGIPDVLDKCPNEPEDKDGFQDDDGCPDVDNDADGIADLNDACPNDKEDGKGKRPADGCPSNVEDNDGDGVPDVRDTCADEPEDKDGFQDDDGCPDYDNDGDGIPDTYDACPNDAEDFDGFEDSDGCPDPDNDHDGIVDKSDKCPNQPETLNFFRDEDGCPDPGAAFVSLGENDVKVFLAEHINFFPGVGGKPQLTTNSHMIVGLVARVLKAHVEVTRVRIDVRGKDASKEATQERGEVVFAELVKEGIDPQRLKVAGLGPGPNRVELIIESRAVPKRAPMPAPSPIDMNPPPASGTSSLDGVAPPPAEAEPESEGPGGKQTSAPAR